MRLSTHVSEDLGLEKSRQSVCSLLHCIFYSCFPIFNSHSPITRSSLQSAGLGAFWHCHWYVIAKRFCLIICNFSKFIPQNTIMSWEFLLLLLSHKSLQWRNCKSCGFPQDVTAGEWCRITFKRPPFQTNVGSYCLCDFIQIIQPLRALGCAICYCDWHPINNQEMVAITIIFSECPLMGRWEKVNKNLWV